MATAAAERKSGAAPLAVAGQSPTGGAGSSAEGVAAGSEGQGPAAAVGQAVAERAAALRPIQKIAILLVGLGPDTGGPILKSMTDEQIEWVTLEILRLGSLDESLVDAVFQEVYERLRQGAVERGGEDYAKELLGRALDKSKAGALLERVSGRLAEGPFGFLQEADPVGLLNMVQGEHPQAIALILAHLPPAQASQVISGLSPDMQADIARRIATMDRTSPDVVRDVENLLKRKISAVVAPRQTKVGGIQYLVNVLLNADRATEKTIMETLEEQNPELAEEIRKNMFTFEDIIRLTDRDMQRIWREVDQKQVALAVRGATDQVKEKFLRNTSQRNRQQLMEDVELLGPTRLSAIEEAQQQIVTVIRRLEQAEEIQIARGAGEELV